MAWNAAMGLTPAELEALDLTCRHEVDLALVPGLPAAEAAALVDQSRQSLQDALGAEILDSRVSRACPDRAGVTSGWDGTITPEPRGRVLRHAAGCDVCGPGCPRNVSAQRVFSLLPEAALAPEARDEILGFTGKPQLSAYREFAVNRAASLAESGFRSRQKRFPR